MSKFLELLAKEPALVGGLASSILPVLALFGVVTMSPEDIAKIVVGINSVVAVIVRFRVYAKPNVPPAKA